MVSVSGGKDSTATLLLALERVPKDLIRPVFADTGNEHELLYEYLGYLERKLGLVIHRVKRNLTEEWWHRRDYVRDKWIEKMVRGMEATEKSEAVPPIPKSQAEEITSRVLAIFEKGPTGNPYLDLCIIKGRFPSRMAQFCTTELKTIPLRQHAYDLVEINGDVEVWQGIRKEESVLRAKLPERDREDVIFENYRPILDWNVQQIFEMHRKHGVDPNPLYKMGMSRVGCMPCINAKKNELLEISKRCPSHIDRIAEWEKLVGLASRRGWATFRTHKEMGVDPTLRPTIFDDVEWARTARGGKQMDFIRDEEPSPGCMSAYIAVCE